MGVVYRESWWNRFRLLIWTVAYLTASAVRLETAGLSHTATTFIAWSYLPCGLVVIPIALRRALPGSYVRVTESGLEGRALRGRPKLVPWNEIRDIEVVERGTGRDGYRYPSLILADGKKAALPMLLTALNPSPPISRIFGKARHYDRRFDETVTDLRRRLAEHQNLETR